MEKNKSGLYKQMEDASNHPEYYNKLTIEDLENFLKELYDGSNQNTNESTK
jgi:hypothetical protein